MSDITLSQSTEIQDPKLRAIVKRVFLTARLAAEKAVAHATEPTNFPLAPDPNSLEQIFLSRFKRLPSDIQEVAVIKSMTAVKASEAARTRIYGDLAKVNHRQATPSEEQADSLPFPVALRLPPNFLNGLTNLHGHIFKLGSFAPANLGEAPAGIAKITALPVTNKLEFRIHRVICVDETNGIFGSERGDDEIALSGTSVDETGTVKPISEFMVRNDFDDGEEQAYSPPRRFTHFNLLEGNKFPKSYFVTLILVEKDMGDIFGFVNKLLDKLKARIKEELVKAGVVVAGESGPVVAKIIAAVVNSVIDAVFKFLAGLFGDDIFTPVTASISVPSLDHRFTNGRTDSPEAVATFRGHGGEYKIVYDWRLFA